MFSLEFFRKFILLFGWISTALWWIQAAMSIARTVRDVGRRISPSFDWIIKPQNEKMCWYLKSILWAWWVQNLIQLQNLICNLNIFAWNHNTFLRLLFYFNCSELNNNQHLLLAFPERFLISIGIMSINLSHEDILQAPRFSWRSRGFKRSCSGRACMHVVAEKSFSHLQGTHARKGNQLVCVKSEADGCDRAENHLYSGIHGDTVS